MRLRLIPMKAIILGVLCGLVLGACGSDGGGGLAAQIDDREFWSTRVVEDDVERRLVDGTRIRLRFDDGDRIGVSAGCNSMGGVYSLNGARLDVTDLAMTEMGCDPERHDQDNFVASLLGSSPTIVIADTELLLSNDRVTVTFIDESIANPDQQIAGTRWVVSGFIDADVAMSFAIDTPAELTFSDEANMSGFDGCAEFSGSVEVSDGSTGGPVEGDGELQFGPVERNRSAPCATLEYVGAFHRLFETGEASFTINGTQLTILNGEGVGTTFTAAE